MKCETAGVKKYSKDLEQDRLEIRPRFTISNANKRISDIMKEKLNYLIEEYRETKSKPNSFSIGYLIYYKLACLICPFPAYCT